MQIIESIEADLFDNNTNLRKEMWKNRSQVLPTYKSPIIQIIENEEIQKKQEEQAAKLDSLTIDEMIEEQEGILITKAKMLYGLDSSRRGQSAGKGMKELKERLKEVYDKTFPRR